MQRALYSAATWLAQPLVRLRLARRARLEPGYGEAVGERFGQYARPALAGVRPLWIHAVSLGETRAAGVLLEALRARMPELRVLLTHGTATGRAEGERWLREGDQQAWLPWDTPQAVARFLDHFQPRMGVLMETEVWPQLNAACLARGVPLVLANARLNERSYLRARKLGALARQAYGGLTVALAQTVADARRLAALGTHVGGIYGNLKFDATPDEAQLEQGRIWRRSLSRPVMLLASSREGEESLFLREIPRYPSANRSVFAIKNEVSRASPSAVGDSPDDAPADTTLCQPMIVPRHPQRFDAVADLAAAQGWAVVRRSAWPHSGPPASDRLTRPTLWLGDTLGEMALYYGLADFALLGGSFEPLGGQNLIEAAACGCPVILGPHTFNFAEAAEQAVAAGAARRVADMSQALVVARQWLDDPAQRDAAARAALAFAAAHRGATERTAQAIEALWAKVATAA